jgi:extradiol dioxygenase family protein
MQPFHLAIAVNDLAKARQFYGEFLGFSAGRFSEKWVDWNCYGHQLVTHLKEGVESKPAAINAVDGHGVPVPHFGVVLEWEQWHKFAERLKAHNVEFIIEPYIRFEGEVGAQATMFFSDPSGNALEFKSFKDPSQLFASNTKVLL